VRDWGAARALAAEVLLPAETLERPLPLTLEPEAHPRLAQRARVSLPDFYRIGLARPLLAGAEGMVFLPGGGAALELAFHPANLTAFPPFNGRPLGKPRPAPGAYFSLLQRFGAGGNYYHWLCDTLPRLYAWSGLTPETRLIVPAFLPTPQKDALTAVGVPAERCIPFDGEETWELERLEFAPPTAPSGYHRPAAIAWLRERVLSAFPAPSGGPVRLFVSRAGAPRRRLVNEEEVLRALAPFGFEPVRLEDLGFAEQVALFRRADCVIGPHGAGFANLVFSPETTRVIEFFEPGYVQYCYWSLCRAQGRPYGYVMGATEPGDAGDLRADAALVVRSLQLLGVEA
jgi:hypothetical protein